jgi:AAA domain-containing protein
MTPAIKFWPPQATESGGAHHARAAAANTAVVDHAEGVLRDALSGTATVERILLKAAAGAGKSHALRRLVEESVAHPDSPRVAVVAFTHRQTHGLAGPLGKSLGKKKICLFVSEKRLPDVPDAVRRKVAIASTATAIPPDCRVVIATCHKLGAPREQERQVSALGAANNGKSPYDVLFVDEAWQIPHHLFNDVSDYAPITVGVGDVGQLPPLESGANPWRGDPGYNPFRAWPTDFDDDEHTWSRELPTVWRPSAGQLGLWRAFYPEWSALDCVAGPDDRSLNGPGLRGNAANIWRQVGTGIPTLLEVDGLPAPESPDVDLPMMGVIESMLDKLFASGFKLRKADYDASGTPTGDISEFGPGDKPSDPLVTILATRNQAVDDAGEMVERLCDKHSLTELDIVSSTVDSYQGQTNGITVAVHPLSGATNLDTFNSAFGRLAVTCTRATHGLLVFARPGLDLLLSEAPVRSGTPFGEPGTRQLPRQTHQRILDTFARGSISLS